VVNGKELEVGEAAVREMQAYRRVTLRSNVGQVFRDALSEGPTSLPNVHFVAGATRYDVDDVSVTAV